MSIQYKEPWKCAKCGVVTREWPNNGKPLIDGKVCGKCNKDVITYRIHLMTK